MTRRMRSGGASAQTAHDLLRAETRAAHEDIDATMSRLDLSTRAGYRTFLEVQATAFLPLEDILLRACFGTICPGWTGRGDLLRNALRAVGGDCRPGPDDDSRQGHAALWGIAYVLEGSRLGGRVLARQVTAGEVGDSPAALAFLSDDTGLRWPVFREAMNRALSDPADRPPAVEAALRTFARFAAAVPARALT